MRTRSDTVGSILAVAVLATYGLWLPSTVYGQQVPDDYPLESVRLGEQGGVRFIVDVTTDGYAINCRVTSSSGFERLDAATCPMVVKRARFTPYSLQEGETALQTYTSVVHWELRK